MDLIIGIIWDFAWWIIGIGVALCMIVVLFGIIKYSMAQGDPNKAAGARATMFGGAFGVVALPVALIAFRIFFSDVIAPNTGVDAGFLEENCDGTLRAQLQAKSDVVINTHAAGLIKSIQAQKSGCAAENWMGAASPLKATSVTDAVTCGLTLTGSALRASAVTETKATGFGRVGGAILIQFDITKATHIAAAEACWAYDPSGGGWQYGVAQ